MREFTAPTWLLPSVETSDKWQRSGSLYAAAGLRPCLGAHQDARFGAVPIVRIPERDQALVPFGRCVSQVWPDYGSTWVKPVPVGGLGMRIRCWQAGH